MTIIYMNGFDEWPPKTWPFPDALDNQWQATNNDLAVLDARLKEVQQIKDEAEREEQLQPLREQYRMVHYRRININMERLKRDKQSSTT